MNLKPLCGILIRVILSVVFAGIFYTAWLAIAIPVLKTENAGIILKTVIWLAAPVVTALGFTTGVFIFELLPGTRKSGAQRLNNRGIFTRFGETRRSLPAKAGKFLNIFKWSLAGCAIGAGTVVWFGPMLIVFGMFLVGTASVALREIIRLRRNKRNISCEL